MAAGSKNKGQNGQPEGERERERHKADAARTANVQHVVAAPAAAVAAAGCKQAMQQAGRQKAKPL